MLLAFTATLFFDLEVPWVYGFPASFYRPFKTRDLKNQIVIVIVISNKNKTTGRSNVYVAFAFVTSLLLL